MLPQYKRKANVAAGIWLASLLVALVASTISRVWGVSFGAEGFLVFLVVFFSAMYYAFWAYAKAKGYGGWIGLVLGAISPIGLIVLVGLRDKHKDGAFSTIDARAKDALPSGNAMPFPRNDWQSPEAAQSIQASQMNSNLRTIALLVCFALFLISATFLPYEVCYSRRAPCEFMGWQWIIWFAGSESKIHWSFLILEWIVLMVSVAFVLFLFRKR